LSDSLMVVFDWVFFFQAEDGIRVFHVTGVQTCALPIYTEGICSSQPIRRRAYCGAYRPRRGLPPCQCRRTSAAASACSLPWGCRSEERRVGKEWRGVGWGSRRQNDGEDEVDDGVGVYDM